MNINSKEYWDDRWENQQTGWDIGYPSPALTHFVDQYPHKDAAILIPGCGNAYEAEYIIDKGFSNLHLIDISESAVQRINKKFAHKKISVHYGDFFEHRGNYDLILEQTFFCALPPGLRENYAKKMQQLLNPAGTLAGVLFHVEFEKAGPPFGGHVTEYQKLFDPYFHIHKMEPCYNSIGPRDGHEVFIHLIKK